MKAQTRTRKLVSAPKLPPSPHARELHSERCIRLASLRQIASLIKPLNFLHTRTFLYSVPMFDRIIHRGGFDRLEDLSDVPKELSSDVLRTQLTFKLVERNSFEFFKFEQIGEAVHRLWADGGDVGELFFRRFCLSFDRRRERSELDEAVVDPAEGCLIGGESG